MRRDRVQRSRTSADVNAVDRRLSARHGVRAIIAAEDVRIQAGRGGDSGARRAVDGSLGPGGALPRIAGIGPGSTRIIREILDTGESPTVERAIEDSDRRADIERRRRFGGHFLSRAAVRRILADPRLRRSHVSSSTAATCKCTPNGATATPRSRRLPTPACSAAINMRRSPIIHTD